MSSKTIKEVLFLRRNFSIIKEEYYFLDCNVEKDDVIYDLILKICENLNKLDKKVNIITKTNIFKELKNWSELGYAKVSKNKSEYSENLTEIFANFLYLITKKIR